MSTPIPPPLRAAAGLAALAIDNARKAPQQLLGLPVLAVSAALQASLKVQQTYAGLVARGDEVLGQLRGQQDAPWARFDEDETPAEAPAAAPAGFPPASAFDAVPDPGPETEVILGDDAALIDEVDRDLDPDTDPDVVSLADAVESLAEQAEADDVNVLGETEEDEEAAADAALADSGVEVVPFDLDRRGPDRSNGQTPLTEPGVDLPADGLALTADASAAEAALAADSALDGYLAVDPPVAGYDDLSIPQLRGRLRSLSVEQVEALLGYERANRARPPYLTMLENRLTTLRSR
ncbi:MAG TPA: lipid droplet-associated protein [Mycobacteriales bacterium]